MSQSTLAHSQVHVSRRLASLLNVEAGEERLIGLLIAFYFVLSLGFAFVQSMAFGLFLSEFGAQGLPYSYIFISAAVSLLALFYLRLSGRVAFTRLLAINVVFLAAASVLIWAALNTALYRPVAFILPTWFQVVVNFGNLAVWPLAGSLFDFRQGKRLFPLLGAGNWLANIIAGLFIPALVQAVGAVHLLLLAGVSFAAALLLLRTIVNSYSKPPAATQAAPKNQAARPGAARQSAKPRPSLLKNRYVLLIFAYTILWWVAFFFIDNVFYDRAYAQYPDANEMTAFLGRLLAMIGVVALISSTVLSSRIIARFGLRAGLAGMPLTVTLGMAVLALTGSLGASLGFAFALVALVKLINVAFGFSLSQSANAIVYQSVPDPLRRQVQTTAEGIVQPLAVGLAGIALLVLTSILKLNFVGLAYVAAGLGVAWLVVILLLSGGYVRALTQVITRRRLGDDANVLADPACVDVLVRRMADPHPGVAIYAINKLEALDARSLADALPGLLEHPASEVRREALQRTEKLKLRNAAGAVQALYEAEREPAVKEYALRALAAIDGTAPQLSEALHAADAPARRGALVGLLKYQNDQAAVQLLERLLSSASTAERSLAIEVIGQVQRREYIPHLLAASASPKTSRAAALALAELGQDALPAIQAAYQSGQGEGQPGPASHQVFTLTKVLARTGGAWSQEILLSRLADPDSELRTRVIAALSQSGYRTRGLAEVRSAVNREVQQAAWTSAVQLDLIDTPGSSLLQSALDQFQSQIRSRVLLLLSFALDGDSIRRVREALQAGSGVQTSYALEIMDVQLPAEWKKLVMPLLENLPPPERSTRLGALFPQISKSPGERLDEIAGSQLPYWLRACAAHTARKGDDAMLSTVEKVLVLKSVPMFSQTPDNVLADIAGLLEEVDSAEGETIIQQGDAGDCMYIILDGKVRVHTGERLVDQLGEHDVFGEMALLDPEPRMASVTALEPTRLFRLNQAPFYELMEERPEVAAGIIRVLTGRLRSRVQDIARLNQRLHELKDEGLYSA